MTARKMSLFLPLTLAWLFNYGCSVAGSFAIKPSGKTLTSEQFLPNAGKMLCFTPDGDHLVAASLDGTIMRFDGTATLWNWRTAKRIQSFTGHQATVNAAAVSSDGKRVATASGLGYESKKEPADNSVRLWDGKSGIQLARFQDHTQTVTQVAFSPDGKLLASAASDDTISIRDLESNQQFKAPAKGQKLLFSADGTRLHLGTATWRIERSPQLVLVRLKSPRWMKNDMILSPDERLAYWLIHPRSPIGTTPFPESLIHRNGFFVCRPVDGTKPPEAWEILGTKDRVGSFEGRDISSDGRRLALTTLRNSMLYDIEARREIAELVYPEGGSIGPYNIFFSPDGKHVAASQGPRIYIWEVP